MKTTEKPPQSEDEGSQAREAGSADADWYWADPRSLKVNPAFQALIPLQSRGEYRALDQSIRAQGCLYPVEVWKGCKVVLDGHTRRELCLGSKQKVKVREVELPDEKAAVAYILQIQRQRRNLTREALSYFRGSEYNALKQLRGGNRRGRRPRGSRAPQSTAAQLADKYGVSEKTVKRDGVFAQVLDQIVADYGDPGVQRQLLSADVKLTHGTAMVLHRMPAGERKKAVDHLVEHGELPRAHPPRDPVARRPRRVAQALLGRLQKKGEEHARAVVQQMARLLGLQVVDPAASR